VMAVVVERSEGQRKAARLLLEFLEEVSGAWN
jgi:hypothetical protein